MTYNSEEMAHLSLASLEKQVFVLEKALEVSALLGRILIVPRIKCIGLRHWQGPLPPDVVSFSTLSWKVSFLLPFRFFLLLLLFSECRSSVTSPISSQMKSSITSMKHSKSSLDTEKIES